MHCCDQSPTMSSSNSTARLIAVCEKEQITSFDKRQIPIHVDDNLIVKCFFMANKNAKKTDFDF